MGLGGSDYQVCRHDPGQSVLTSKIASSGSDATRLASVTRNSPGAPRNDFTNSGLSTNVRLRPVFVSSITVRSVDLHGLFQTKVSFARTGTGRSLEAIGHDGVGFMRETMDHQEGLGVTRQPQLFESAGTNPIAGDGPDILGSVGFLDAAETLRSEHRLFLRR